MRKFILCAALACALVTSLGAQVLDKPAATVRYTKTESITVTQLQKQITAFEASARRVLTTDERKQVLDSMIAQALLLQAAAKENVVVSDAQLKTAIATYEQQLGQGYGLGRPLTEAELQQYVKSSGQTYDVFLKSLRDQQTVYSYIQKKKPNIADSIKQPTDQEIQDYYDANKRNFFMDDMITFRHIFIDTTQLTSKEDRDKAAKHADDILKELKGGASFTDLVTKYSDDSRSKYSGGLYPSIFRNDEQRRQAFGATFFDALFRMKKGDTSAVLQSNAGFHIVQITDRIDARLLGLDDKIPPQNTATVRDTVKSAIMINRQNAAWTQAQTDIVADLRKTAEVNIFNDNIAW
jgi:peptidyl-prolyl cis-trans isomerase SurA